MKVEQFVMAYRVEQDRIRTMLPEGVVSLRSVLMINAEIRDEKRAYVEFNAPVEYKGKRGWMNIDIWEGEEAGMSFEREGKRVRIETDFLSLSYEGVGI